MQDVQDHLPREDFSQNSHSYRYFLRYFEKHSLRCNLCNEPGHISNQCYKALLKCIYCADQSHTYKRCPQSLCHKCRIPGHTAKNCDMEKKCLECNASGHSLENCMSRCKPLSDSMMNEVRCLKCMQKGHANCIEKLENFALSKIICFICGFKGHSDELCPEVGKMSKLDLFREYVNEAMDEMPSGDRSDFKERRYWQKVNNKVYKKLLKKEMLKKKKEKEKEKKKKKRFKSVCE